MNKTVFFGFIFLVALQVNSFGQKNKERHNIKADTLAVDSLEYSLVVLDPEFEAWLAKQPSKNFYSQKYYENRNQRYVSEWNQRYLSSGSQNSDLYETYIDYDYQTDYGLDLNYKLYYYFRFFEETNHIRLLNTSR
jgi:hypothetical protein